MLSWRQEYNAIYPIIVTQQGQYTVALPCLPNFDGLISAAWCYEFHHWLLSLFNTLLFFLFLKFFSFLFQISLHLRNFLTGIHCSSICISFFFNLLFFLLGCSILLLLSKGCTTFFVIITLFNRFGCFWRSPSDAVNNIFMFYHNLKSWVWSFLSDFISVPHSNCFIFTCWCQ